MMTNFSEGIFNSISIISLITGFISVTVTAFTIYRNKRNQKEYLNQLKKIQFETVLKSNDIERIGYYLDEEVGRLYVTDYVDNKELNKNLDILINKLISFIGSEEKVESETKKERSKKKKEDLSQVEKSKGASKYDVIYKELEQLVIEGGNNPIFKSIIEDFQHGKSWNATAQMRAEMERALREYSFDLGIKNRKVPIPNLLRVLDERQEIDKVTKKMFQEAFEMVNKLIHGYEGTFIEVENALKYGIIAINRLNNTSHNNE